jgi:hypothetical protein
MAGDGIVDEKLMSILEGGNKKNFKMRDHYFGSGAAGK